METSDNSRESDQYMQNIMWEKHDDRIDATEKGLSEVRDTIYGPDKHPHLGLEKRVEELEKGFWAKLLRWFKWLGGITAVALVVGAIADALDLWHRFFSSSDKD